jgi:hypothetical protein
LEAQDETDYVSDLGAFKKRYPEARLFAANPRFFRKVGV